MKLIPDSADLPQQNNLGGAVPLLARSIPEVVYNALEELHAEEDKLGVFCNLTIARVSMNHPREECVQRRAGHDEITQVLVR